MVAAKVEVGAPYGNRLDRIEFPDKTIDACTTVSPASNATSSKTLSTNRISPTTEHAFLRGILNVISAQGRFL